MPRLRFSVSTLILGVLIASLIFALIYQISINSKLREDNESMRNDLGLPSEMVPGKFFAMRAFAAPVTEEYNWVWRVIVPEGERYQLLVQSKDIPTADSGRRYPNEGTEVLRVGPGETLIRASVIQNGVDSILIVECASDRIEHKFDGSFLSKRPESGTLLGTSWQSPPDKSFLHQSHTEDPKKIHDIDGIPHAEVGLQIWLERVEDKQDSSPE